MEVAMISLRSTLQAGVVIVVAVVTISSSFQAAAQEVYPNRPIRMILPFPAGGALDVLARIVTEKAAGKLGQPIIIDNRPGASGNIGAEIVANAKADGYTLLAAPPPPLVVNQSLFAQLPFDPTKFVPVTVIASAPNVLVVHPKHPVNNVSEFIAYARSRQGKLNYASTGSGGTPHLTTEWFKSLTNVQTTHVPYKGFAPAIPPLLAGEVDMMFMNIADALPHIVSGRLKALGIGSEQRSAALPEVRPFTETIPGFISSTWYAVVATPKTPAPIAEKLSTTIAASLRQPDVASKLAELHLDPIGGTPAQTAVFLKAEAERWGKVIRSANIKAD
jgi:tripartite-type tricarboxylate transporter receptor subunit TctC